MSTGCNGNPIVFQGHGRREVTASFDGGRLSSDGGALLLRGVDNVFGVTGRLTGCFSDHRDPGRSEHALDRLVAHIREAWPEVRILARGDSGFCREAIMAWCEANGVGYVFGVARNARLVRKIARQMRRSRSRCVTTSRPSRRFRDFRHRTLTSRSRRVVGKAEVLPGLRGANPRFVVTSLSVREIGARTGRPKYDVIRPRNPACRHESRR